MKRFTVKLTIGWLPVGSRLKYYGNEVDTCHLCPLSETPSHLFQCTHRLPFFLSRDRLLQEFLHQINTPAEMILPLVKGILHWALDYPPCRIDPFLVDAPDPVRRCYTRQTAAGWDLATLGMLDSSWSKLIHDPRCQNLATKWQSEVTTWLLTSAQSLWQQRNSERHTADPQQHIDATRRETETKLHHLFSLAESHLTPLDRHELIRTTLVERLALPEPTNRLWASQVLPLVYRRIKYHRDNPRNQDIRAFYYPTTEAPTNTITTT